MAIDDTGGGNEQADSGGGVGRDPATTVGDYSWSDFRREEHDGGQFDRTAYLGFDPRDLPRKLEAGASAGKTLQEQFEEFCDPERTPVVKDTYSWEHFKRSTTTTRTGTRLGRATGKKNRSKQHSISASTPTKPMTD